jgi:hypothetical protein
MYLNIDFSHDLMTVNERLLQFLKEGKDWERKTTNIHGVFLLKLPIQINLTEGCICASTYFLY